LALPFLHSARSAYYLKTRLNETLITGTIIVAFLVLASTPESGDQSATQLGPVTPEVGHAVTVLRRALDALDERQVYQRDRPA